MFTRGYNSSAALRCVRGTDPPWVHRHISVSQWTSKSPSLAASPPSWAPVAEKTMVYGRYNERWWENKPTNITGEHHPVYCLFMGISWKHHGNMMRLNIVQNRSLMGFIWRCPFCHGGIPKSSSHHGWPWLSLVEATMVTWGSTMT